MTRVFILFTFLFTSLTFWSQVPQLELALNNIDTKAEQWELKKSDYQDMMVSSIITTDKGITYLYLHQTYQNIPINNAMMTVIIKEDKVVSDMHNLEKNIQQRVNSTSAKIDAPTAIISSAKHLGIDIRQKPAIASRSNEGKMKYTLPEMVNSEIPAELKYEVVGDRLVLVWNLNLDLKANADYWDINIDAQTGEFVSKYNLTIYCQHHKDAFTNHDNCSIRTFRKLSDNAQPASKIMNGSGATYNVYKLPVESPRHGDRSIATDGEYPDASPFGWHATGMTGDTKFRTTRGNNVYAFEDKNDNDLSDGDDPDGGENLVFDFPMDLNEDPRESNYAAVTNLFYMVNMMHDITYKLGFDEAFGNFQQTNYTNEGRGNDFVLAQAFDGITLHERSPDPDNPKINNANFATPPDGSSGRMQMYLWNNNGGAVSIDSPESISGFVRYGVAQFGRPIPNAIEPAVVGKIVIALDGSSNPTELCNNASNSNEINGNIALVDRGSCQFSQKVWRAQQAGAIAVIICNIPGADGVGSDGEQTIGMAAGNFAQNINIPSAFFGKSNCDKIRFEIASGNEVTMTFKERGRVGAEYFDGSLDNGIIAHEFGHGISNRLTGGPAAAGCLRNGEQMGEGWSDFYTLITAHKPGDTGANRRGIGTFASGQTTDGRGIRRFAYSTDMTINPQTFDDIKGTTGPHPLGEIWAGMLWDMYWAFVDKYGYDEDWNNEESGNFIANYLVMEGMKMQPCSPGFIEGRDAILKADEVHYNGENSCLIWEVFAKRGLGFYAVGGSTADRNDGTQDFEPFPLCLEKLKISKISDTSVDSGEAIDVELKAINHIPNTQTNVVVTDELPSGMTYVAGSSNIEPKIQGNLLVFELGDMEYQDEITIKFKTQSSPNNKSLTLEFDNFDDGSNEWEIETDEGDEFWYLTADIYQSPETAYTIQAEGGDMDAALFTIPYEVKGQNPTLKFSQRYNTQTGIDGGFVEISANNGPYEMVTNNKFIRNGYSQPLAYGTLARVNINVFSGNSGGDWAQFNSNDAWIDSYIDLSDYVGQSIQIKFRYVAATVQGGTEITSNFRGWFIDDFEILDLYKYASKACITAEGLDAACTEVLETLVNGGVGTNTDDEAFFTDTKILPNPAGDYFVLAASAPFSTNAKIHVTSIDGRSVLTSEMSLTQDVRHKSFDISGWNAGMYFVTLSHGDNISTFKLVKN